MCDLNKNLNLKLMIIIHRCIQHRPIPWNFFFLRYKRPPQTTKVVPFWCNSLYQYHYKKYKKLIISNNYCLKWQLICISFQNEVFEAQQRHTHTHTLLCKWWSASVELITNHVSTIVLTCFRQVAWWCLISSSYLFLIVMRVT